MTATPRILAALLLLACSSALHAAEPTEVLQQIRSAVLEPERAVEVNALEIDLGLGVLHIEQGWLVPAQAIEGHTTEIVFLGQARFRIEPPDEIEAAHLELFTGESRLDEEISQAVLAGEVTA